VDNIQAWLPQWRQLGLALADIHGWLGNALMWFAALRATAALYHHFWQRTPFEHRDMRLGVVLCRDPRSGWRL
jgi:cytochrome b561